MIHRTDPILCYTAHRMSGLEASLDLDVFIRELLNQQAEIQARLAALLVTQHGFNATSELDMLRHKLHVLENIASHRGRLGLDSYYHCLGDQTVCLKSFRFEVLRSLIGIQS